MRRKITQRNIAIMCGCTEVYVSRVLNNPKEYDTEKAAMIKRFAHDHIEQIVKHPLFLELIKRYKPKTQDEDDTLDEWKYTAKLYNNKLKEISKIK